MTVATNDPVPPTSATYVVRVEAADGGRPCVHLEPYVTDESCVGADGATRCARSVTGKPAVAGREIKVRGDLSGREREVAAMAAHGFTNDEIGELMILAPTTIKFHLKNLFEKTGLRNRVQLTAWVWQTGIDRLAAPYLPDPSSDPSPTVARTAVVPIPRARAGTSGPQRLGRPARIVR